MIYFDNSATTLHKPDSVADAVYEAIASQQFANPGRSAHKTAHAALASLYKTRAAVARIFHIKDPLQVALCQNATAALNLVLKSLFGAGDHLITTTLEHNSVLRPLYQLESQGAELSIIGFDLETGELDYAAMEAAIRGNTKAVIVTACSNVIGAVPDMQKIYGLCRKNGLTLIIDASQSAGTMSMNLSQYEQTIVCFTGHKGLYGPQGTGGIAVNGDFAFMPVFSGGSGIHSFDKTHPATMPDVFEAGTMNVPSFAGLAAGCAYIEQLGQENAAAYLANLRSYFFKLAADLPFITLYAPKTQNPGPVISLNLKTAPSSEVSRLLDERYGIATRPGAHCAPLVHHAYKTEAQGMVRFSFSTFNTTEEIEAAIDALGAISESF